VNGEQMPIEYRRWAKCGSGGQSSEVPPVILVPSVMIYQSSVQQVIRPSISGNGYRLVP
jgi:hypothetical protein